MLNIEQANVNRSIKFLEDKLMDDTTIGTKSKQKRNKEELL